MGNALPVQEPTMDEILASIRRIIEGRDESEMPADKTQDRILKSVPRDVVADEPIPEFANKIAEPVQKEPAHEMQAEPANAGWSATRSPAETELPPVAPSLKAVNDEGTTPFAGAKTSDVERQVASQMEELATVSVARMRAASLEDAVRGFRKQGAETAGVEAQGATDIGADVFSDEFDEAAFATELLVNAGLMDEPVSQPETVTPAEAVKLRLAYPESPAEGDVEAEASLETAIGVVTELSDAAESTPAANSGAVAEAVAAKTETALSDKKSVSESGSASVTDATRGALVSMISGDAEGKIQSSFTELAAALRDEQARRMDATVREMLQPMLSDWLEDNLPVIVERLVREEIERVARGPKRA